MEIRFKKLNTSAVEPTYAKEGDAGMDIVATSVVDNGNQVICTTGLAVEIPMGYVGLIFPRSSIVKYDLSLSNSVGVIDSGYRGELLIIFNKLQSARPEPIWYQEGDRIAQLIILAYPKITWRETDKLSDTPRNVFGFGSTGD